MTPEQVKAGRLSARLTQAQAARRLGVSQPYLSQLETGDRPVTPELARAAAAAYRLSPTALPLPETVESRTDPNKLARELAGLGYPGFAYMHGRKANPAVVLFEALRQSELEARLAEALPWVVLTYSDLDWPWLLRQVKLRDAQNRLGFVVAMAKQLASARLPQSQAAFERLSAVEQQLDHARLAREDTFGRSSMAEAERNWLATARSQLAVHWNLLTGLSADQLPYAA
jgi:transcriptional regulator with XRE-family HTH domain